MASRVLGLSRGTLPDTALVCHDCVWWQSRGNKTASKERWIEKVEDDWGEWGTVYYGGDGKALEAFAYRYPEGQSAYERFLVHRTVFPRDFLADFGFQTVRAQGNVE